MAQGEIDLMTVDDVARALGVNDSRVRQLARAGALQGTRLGRAWLFTPEAVAEFKARPRRPGRPRKQKD